MVPILKYPEELPTDGYFSIQPNLRVLKYHQAYIPNKGKIRTKYRQDPNNDDI